MDRELEIYKTLYVRMEELGRYTVEDETLIHYYFVYGNDKLGYIGCHEEWFSPNRQGHNVPEFYEVKWSTNIFDTAQEAWDRGFRVSRNQFHDIAPPGVYDE